VFKALELIEFADLIPPLQAELQGTPSLRSPSPLTSSTPIYSLPRALQEQKGVHRRWRVGKRTTGAQEQWQWLGSSTREGQGARGGLGGLARLRAFAGCAWRALT
jgi:hypothetical protein